MYTLPSNCNAGGVASYVNNKLNHFKRNDLGKLNDFESVWIEIKKERQKKFSVWLYL